MRKIEPNATPTDAVFAGGRLWLLGGLCALALAGAFLTPPIAQDPAYHQFADREVMFGVVNFRNVASSALFVVAGVFGLFAVSRLYHNALRAQYLLLCLAAVLTGFGSAYYHLQPSNASLLWDRLPMTMLFMALFSIVISDRISLSLGRRLLVPLLVVGAGSVVYWNHSEMMGRGDLRGYLLVQFLPMLLIPLMLALFEGRGLRARWLCATLAIYAAAKFAEQLDVQIFETIRFVSGHGVKHLLAAVALLLAITAVHRRELPRGD